MGISERTRKSLWGKSGNRCSICKIEFFSGKENTEEFNIGEECHIISSKPNGPRHKPNIGDYDLYDNLILLCRNHHREIDELTDTYTEEILRYMKLNHEDWVKATLSAAIDSDKRKEPKFLTRITSGKDLLKIITDFHSCRVDYDEVDNADEAQYIGGVIQEIVDCGEASGMVEFHDKVQIGFELTKLLGNLEEKGYYLFGERNVGRVKYEYGEIDNWSTVTLVVKRKDSSEIVKFDLDDA